MLNSIITLEFLMIIVTLIIVVSLVASLIIETIKKVVSEEKIKREFSSMEIFSLVITSIIALVVYAIFLLFYINCKISFLDFVKLFVVCIVFIISCGCGSQVGYDKVIKTIKQIIDLFKGGSDLAVF